jgi:ectoine hydroxylase-related dioxygenase (phytanoyl-CoA dioxygenase family)
MTPSREQIAAYHQQGFVYLPGVVEAARLAELVSHLDVVARDIGHTDSAWRGKWREQFTDGDRFTLKTIDKLARRSQFWKAWLSSRDMLDPLEALSGVPMQHVDAMLILKPPETGQAFPPHQDAAYYAADEPGYIIATLHLDAATTENGALRFLPGSHAQGLIEHRRQGKAYLPDVDIADLIEVPAQPGDLVCSSIYTVHGSLPNRSDRPRAIVRIGYQPVRGTG